MKKLLLLLNKFFFHSSAFPLFTCAVTEGTVTIQTLESITEEAAKRESERERNKREFCLTRQYYTMADLIGIHLESKVNVKRNMPYSRN